MTLYCGLPDPIAMTTLYLRYCMKHSLWKQKTTRWQTGCLVNRPLKKSWQGGERAVRRRKMWAEWRSEREWWEMPHHLRHSNFWKFRNSHSVYILLVNYNAEFFWHLFHFFFFLCWTNVRCSRSAAVILFQYNIAYFDLHMYTFVQHSWQPDGL